MNDVVITGYLRTANSRSKPADPEKDCFGNLRADELLARVVSELIDRNKIAPGEIDDLLVGSALGVGEQWTFGGRTPVFLSNLSDRVPAKFLDQQCGSGMAAVHVGFMEIAGGFADVVVACGMEHLTRVPMGPYLFEQGTLSVHPALYQEARYRHWEMEVSMNMGLTAEKLFDGGGFTREDLDAWAVRSHRLAGRAIASGFLKDEILPVEVITPDGETRIIDRDQTVREDASMERLSTLKPVFKPDGAVTAGNASPLNAGAGALVMMSRREAEKRNLPVLAAIRSIGFAGVDPTLMGTGPVPATRRALNRIGFSPDRIDYWEINEAFSIVVLHCMRELGIEPERVNVMGGALALGHPLGATGIRITGTLARILKEKRGRWGCAAACVGGGQGVAIVLERE